MATDHDSSQQDEAADRTGQRKRYETPRILSVESLEVLAATCDPSGGGKADALHGCSTVTQS